MSIRNISQKISHGNISVGLTSLIQIGKAILSFIMVPLLINFLSVEDYSLWVTLLSLIMWIGIFDFGIGYSFKNKITEYLVNNNKLLLHEHFKQSIHYYFIFTLLVLIAFFFMLFNVEILNKNKLLCLVIYIPFILSFPTKINAPILQGLRLTHQSNSFELLKAFLFAVVTIGYIKFLPHTNSILYLALSYSLLHFTINWSALLYSIRKLKLDIKDWSFLIGVPVFNKLIKTGLQFFILQISSLILFSMGNYYIYSFLDNASTINYDTINRLFLFAMGLFNIIISVYWAEIVFYKTSKKHKKLLVLFKNLLLVSILFSIGLFISTLFLPYLIKIWTNNKVVVKVTDCIPFAFLLSIQSVAYVGAVYLNAYEKVKTQIILVVVNLFLFPFILNYGFSCGLGIATPPIASGIIILPSAIILNILAFKLIKK